MDNYFSSNLKFLRESNNLSKTELSKKIKVHQSTISRWESGEMGATVDNILDIAEALNISIPDLIGKDLKKENISPHYPQKSQPHVIYTDEETGLSVAFVSPDGRNWEELSKEEQEAYVSEAMDNLYEYKRNLKEKD